MKILVIGASKGTGALAVKEALARGHDVTAFSRNPQQLEITHPKLKKLPGNFHDASSVLNAVRGHDAVIVTASSPTLKGFKEKPDFFSSGTQLIIDAMKASGVRRLIVLSALGVGESRSLIPLFVRSLVIGIILKRPYADHERQEKLVFESGLEWVVARPSRLTDGQARKKYQKTAAIEKIPTSISRADVADFLVEAATTPNWIGKSVQLGG